MDYEDEDMLGSEDEILGAAGDELDLAETIDRINPIADELPAFAQRRNVKHALLNRQAPFIRNNPPSILKGSLGNQAVVARNQKIQVANWNGEDAETLPITISFATPSVTPLLGEGASKLGVRPFGIIQFGTRGSLFTAEVDIGRGCQLTVSGSTMTVQVALDDTSANNPVVLLGAMLSFHPIVRTQQITRTVYYDTNSAVITVDAIPAFAKSLIVVKKAAILAKDVGVVFFDSSGFDCGGYDIPVNTQQSVAFAVPPDAQTFSVTNVTDTTVAKSRAIFNLAL